jgi:hypothetical protein
MNALQAKIENFSTENLIDLAKTAAINEGEDVDTVLETILDALMARMPEPEFVAFCDSL